MVDTSTWRTRHLARPLLFVEHEPTIGYIELNNNRPGDATALVDGSAGRVAARPGDGATRRCVPFSQADAGNSWSATCAAHFHD
jgi:hypothetical protein